jgi:hypothetical protein
MKTDAASFARSRSSVLGLRGLTGDEEATHAERKEKTRIYDTNRKYDNPAGS